MGPFHRALLDRHLEWRDLALESRTGEGWQGLALVVHPPAISKASFPLIVEEVADEVTISFDHAHIHMDWPPPTAVPLHAKGTLWNNPLLMIDAILDESVVSSSGWIDGKLCVASLHERAAPPNLYFHGNLQAIRVRSWRGNFDVDEVPAKLRRT